MKYKSIGITLISLHLSASCELKPKELFGITDEETVVHCLEPTSQMIFDAHIIEVCQHDVITYTSGSSEILALRESGGKGDNVDSFENKSEGDQRSVLKKVINKKRIEVEKTRDWPYRVHGQVRACFVVNGQRKWLHSSGTLVGPAHVLTVGHSFFDHDEHLGWAQSVEFIPALCNNVAPFGRCEGRILLTSQQWHNEANHEHDYGLIVLNQTIGERVGWLGMASLPDKLLKVCLLTISGYPIDKAKKKGQHNSPVYSMWEMSHIPEILLPHEIRYLIDTFEGTSGSGIWGWLPYLQNQPYVLGIHAYSVPGVYNCATRLTETLVKRISDWIRKISPTKKTLPLILQELETNSVESLRLSYLTVSATRQISQKLPQATALKNLELQVANVRNYTSLIETLRNNRGLTSLSLAHCEVTDHTLDQLQGTLSSMPRLRSLNLASNKLTRESLPTLTKIIATCTSLTSLDIANTELNSSAVHSLESLCEKNRERSDAAQKEYFVLVKPLLDKFDEEDREEAQELLLSQQEHLEHEDLQVDCKELLKIVGRKSRVALLRLLPSLVFFCNPSERSLLISTVKKLSGEEQTNKRVEILKDALALGKHYIATTTSEQASLDIFRKCLIILCAEKATPQVITTTYFAFISQTHACFNEIFIETLCLFEAIDRPEMLAPLTILFHQRTAEAQEKLYKHINAIPQHQRKGSIVPLVRELYLSLIADDPFKRLTKIDLDEEILISLMRLQLYNAHFNINRLLPSPRSITNEVKISILIERLARFQKCVSKKDLEAFFMDCRNEDLALVQQKRKNSLVTAVPSFEQNYELLRPRRDRRPSGGHKRSETSLPPLSWRPLDMSMPLPQTTHRKPSMSRSLSLTDISSSEDEGTSIVKTITHMASTLAPEASVKQLENLIRKLEVYINLKQLNLEALFEKLMTTKQQLSSHAFFNGLTKCCFFIKKSLASGIPLWEDFLPTLNHDDICSLVIALSTIKSRVEINELVALQFPKKVKKQVPKHFLEFIIALLRIHASYRENLFTRIIGGKKTNEDYQELSKVLLMMSLIDPKEITNRVQTMIFALLKHLRLEEQDKLYRLFEEHPQDYRLKYMNIAFVKTKMARGEKKLRKVKKAITNYIKHYSII